MGPEGGGVRDVGSIVPGSSDPIFQGVERPESTTKRSALLYQFFLFPLLIVVASVCVFLFFGAIGGAAKSPEEYLQDVRTGGENVQKQAVQQLSERLREEDTKKKDRPADEPLFAENPKFRGELERAFTESFDAEHTTDRRVFLARALGWVGDSGYLEALAAHVGPREEPEVRRAVALAIGGLRTDRVVTTLAGLLGDADESVVNFAIQGLSRHRTPESIAALKGALEGGTGYARQNAALALAYLGDASGVAAVERLLDPKHVEAEVGRSAPEGFSSGRTGPDRDDEVRRGVLLQAIQGASRIGDARLKPKIEALQGDRDQQVRETAQRVLADWK